MNFKTLVFLIFVILSIAIMTTSKKTKNRMNAKTEIELKNESQNISKEKLIADIKKKMEKIASELKKKKS